MFKRINTPPQDRGLTLLELMIAILVLTIGTLALMRTLDQSTRELGESPQRLFAQHVAANRASELQITGYALGRGLPNRVTQGPYSFDIKTTGRRTDAGLYETTLRITTPDGPGTTLVTFIPWEPPK